MYVNLFVEEGLFPHTSSCSKFYECSNGQIFAKDCAPGTLYNPLIKQCDHPEKSGCTVNKQGQVEFVWKEVFTVNEENSDIENQLNVNRPFETTQHVSSVRTITSQKIVCLKEGIFPHPTSCVHFYVCRNGELSTQNCSQEGTMYNPLTNVCDVPEKSGCKIGTNGQVEFEWKSEIKTDLPNGHHYHHHHITNEMDQSNVVVDSKEKSFTISKTICLGNTPIVFKLILLIFYSNLKKKDSFRIQHHATNFTIAHTGSSSLKTALLELTTIL